MQRSSGTHTSSGLNCRCLHSRLRSSHCNNRRCGGWKREARRRIWRDDRHRPARGKSSDVVVHAENSRNRNLRIGTALTTGKVVVSPGILRDPLSLKRGVTASGSGLPEEHIWALDSIEEYCLR